MKSYNSELFKPLTEKIEAKEIDKMEEKIKQAKKEYFQKNYQQKKLINEIPNDKFVLPKHITVYDEKGTTYIQYNKTNKEGRYTKKHKITTNDIQKEVDKLVNDVNEKYPDYKLFSEKQIVINPELFKLKEQPKIIIDNVEKPDLPINFSICKINGVDYFQYCKKEDDHKNQKQRRINSYNIQEEFNDFVKFVNESFELKLEFIVIKNSQNWKTTNKIIIKEETDIKIKNREKSNKALEKRKLEMGEEAFNALKAQQAKERRKKKKEENIDI